MTRGNMPRNIRSNPSPSSTVYRGPIHLPTGDGAADDAITVNVAFTQAVASDSTGTIAGAYTNADVGTFSNDWVSYALNYAECRVLGFTAEWLPKYNMTYTAFAVPTTGLAAVSHVTPVPTPSSLDAVGERSSRKRFPSGAPFRITYRMSSVEEASFSSTSTIPVGHGGIQYYLDGLTPSTVYGSWLVTYLVQFRNRR